MPLEVALPLWLFPYQNPSLTGVTIAFGIYHAPPLHALGIHWWIFRNKGQQNQDIPLEGIVVEEPTTLPQSQVSPTGTGTGTIITQLNSQADNSYLAPPIPSQVQEQITLTSSAHTGSSQTPSS
jgi:hypothetical protein